MADKRLGIVICNYNKADMVLECIKCIFENTFTDFDLYVVDNASTDNSVEAITEAYGDRLTLIVNEENLGGTGGFNTGLRAAYAKGYPYLMCVDNDAYLDENAIEELYKFLEQHTECGMAASKIYHMDNPGLIQQYGQDIDFTSFCTCVPELNMVDDGSLPDFKYVDTVAACSLMVRRETIDKIGFMSEEYYLYWDDTDWCWRAWIAGLKVASVGTSLALHQMGAKKERINTFPTYYAWRNWIRFFIKYTAKEDRESMARTFIKSLFSAIYCGQHKDEHRLNQTLMLAYDDAIHGRTGKAGPNRIFELDINYAPFSQLFSTFRVMYIEEGDFPTLAQRIRDIAEKIGANVIWASAPGEGVKTIRLCETIFTIDDMSLEYVYIDVDLCIFSNKVEALDVINYNYSYRTFLEAQLPVFLQCMEEY